MTTSELKDYVERNQWYILIGTIGLILFFQILSQFDSKPSPTQAIQEQVEIDTMIPKNHSLFPLNLVNQKSVSAVLGPYGVVDLYRYYNETKRKLIAKNIRMFRAPKDPESFYVLVPDNKANTFINENDKTFAVIKNRTETAPVIGQKKNKSRRISIGVEQ